MLSAK